MLTDRRQQRQPNHNTTTVSKHNMWSYYDWVYCCCRPPVNTICGRIMIGLSLLSSVSKHNMWSYYDWVYCCCPPVKTICDRIMIGFIVVVVRHDHILRLLTDDNNDNPIIIRRHIVFTGGRQQQ
jgi:hypothetical protein